MRTFASNFKKLSTVSTDNIVGEATWIGFYALRNSIAIKMLTDRGRFSPFLGDDLDWNRVRKECFQEIEKGYFSTTPPNAKNTCDLGKLLFKYVQMAYRALKGYLPFNWQCDGGKVYDRSLIYSVRVTQYLILVRELEVSGLLDQFSGNV